MMHLRGPGLSSTGLARRFLSSRTAIVVLCLVWLPIFGYLCIERMTIIRVPGFNLFSFRDVEVQGTDDFGTRLLLPWGWPQVGRWNVAGVTVLKAAKGGQVGWYIWFPYWPLAVLISVGLVGLVRRWLVAGRARDRIG